MDKVEEFSNTLGENIVCEELQVCMCALAMQTDNVHIDYKCYDL
jgi:hypothetical protein